MRRTISSILILTFLLLLLPGCGGDNGGADPAGAETDYNSAQLAAALLESQREPPEMYFLTADDAEFSAYAAVYLGEELASRVTDGSICYPFGPLASEVAVFAFTDSADAESAVEPMEAYIEARVSAFFGYAPEEAELAEEGRAGAYGRFAVLYILAGPAAAERALERAFSENAPEPPELAGLASPLHWEPAAPDGPASGDTEIGPDDAYDHDAVLSALKTGCADGLSPKNRAVYEAAMEVMAEIITPDMTDYERELAVNDYLVLNARYDPAELSSGPVGAPDPDNDNPYGLLVNGVGICLGYTTTFQLFMDALGIECVTVHGYAYGRSEEHAWNLVRLEGDWYAVDVTWNDPVYDGWVPADATILACAHVYFNVTSDFLRETDHEWDEDVPEATGTKYACLD